MTIDARTGVADLVRKARDRRASIREQHAAYAILVERFESMTMATALRAGEDMEAARDACQEAFLQAWRTLPELREPAAFGSWLKRLVRTQCARARRRRCGSVLVANRTCDPVESVDSASDPAELASRKDTLRSILQAVDGLPVEEREAITLFYFLGAPLRVVAQTLGVSVGMAGKRLYTARLRLRRLLPRSITESFLVVAPTLSFARRVEAGILDEFVGEYRFTNRPDHIVIIRREGRVLAGYAGGQRSVLASRKQDTLRSTEYDGEGRFHRNRLGHVSHFIYYEFGRRLGVAKKVNPASPPQKSFVDRMMGRGGGHAHAMGRTSSILSAHPGSDAPDVPRNRSSRNQSER